MSMYLLSNALFRASAGATCFCFDRSNQLVPPGLLFNLTMLRPAATAFARLTVRRRAERLVEGDTEDWRFTSYVLFHPLVGKMNRL